jgi:hypothetical protein
MSESRYARVTYVDEGMPVIAPFNRQTGQGIRCVVATACGYHARVVNEQYQFDRWFHIDDLRQEPSTK